MVNKIYELSEEDFTSLIRSSSNKAEVLFKLGYSVEGNSWGYNEIRTRMKELNLTDSDFKGRSVGKIKLLRINKDEDVLCIDSPHSRAVVRRYILKNNLLPYKCACCGNNGIWNEQLLSLHLDHINGICSDHRLENLRWLCPNCHSQTETHGSKNDAYSTREEKIKAQYDLTPELKETVINTYKELGSIDKVSIKLVLSKYAVKFIIDEAGLNKRNNEYVIRYDLNHNEIARYGSINEMCQAVINAGETKTQLVKTCRNTFNRNKDKIWLNSYWKVFYPDEYERNNI